MGFDVGNAWNYGGRQTTQAQTTYGGDYAGQTSQAWNAATQANLQRYNQILSGYDATRTSAQSAAAALQNGYQKRYDQIMAQLAGYGDAQQADLRQGFANQQGAMAQRMTSAGLRGTTAYGTAAGGLQRQQALASGQLADSITRTRLGYQGQLSQDMLQAQQYGAQNLQGLDLQKYGFMNSRTDAYPDVNSMAQMYQARGRAQGQLAYPSYGGQESAPRGAALSYTPNYWGGANYYADPNSFSPTVRRSPVRSFSPAPQAAPKAAQNAGGGSDGYIGYDYDPNGVYGLDF